MDRRANLESIRLNLQAELDQQKTNLERNRLGQYATPTMLAREVLSYALKLIPKGQSIRFLDPAIGTGSFYSALREECGKRQIKEAKGFEVDPFYGGAARELWADSGLDLEIADFTQAVPPKAGYNLLICNPPYVRHHHLTPQEKKRLQIASNASAGVCLSGLAGLYCHFMAISHPWMSDDGIAGWLIPSEFMDVNYGQELKRYLLEEVTLLRIHRFDPNDVQFDDALVSSAVVWFKKAKPSSGHEVEFSFGGTHAAPAISRFISASALKDESKWTRFPKLEVRPAESVHTLSDFFTIKRGIATGSNDFFILNKEAISRLGLPMKFFTPILPSPRYLNNDAVEADEQGNPILKNELFLLNCSLPESEIKANYPSLWRYLESGREEVGSRYLCRSRPIWYKQESREPAKIVCTYMGRHGNDGRNPFRFILNDSRAVVANTYLMLYPKPNVADIFNRDEGVQRAVWKELNNLGPESLISEGRVYGGGLHKVEPKELAKVPVERIALILASDEQAV